MENIGRKMVEIAENTVPSVTAREVYEKKEAGEPMVILDIREPDEWEKGVIEGAVLLSRGRLEGRLEEMVPDKDAY
ncbi:MAG: molybdopterin biosynthesis protein MoeB, partial [Dehalococcoidia bacterium]|nr:molybdopterin biosynthesis protein MoeB [Dehalococcoidia bacterium]